MSPDDTPTLPRSLDALLTQLRADFPTLSAQFQSGARYLLDHPHDIALHSMRKVAANAGVQPAILVRLSQSLGFEGWQVLRELFAEAMRDQGAQPYAKRARKVVKESRLQPDAGRDDRGAASQPGRTAGQQRRVRRRKRPTCSRRRPTSTWRASAPASRIAFTFHYIYRLFRSSVHLVRGDAGTLEMELRALTAKDVVLVTAFAPYSQESLRVASAAREAGCKVVALTDSTVAPIALEADCTLLFAIDSPSFFPSITAGAAMVEALVEQLLARKGTRRDPRARAGTEGQLHRTGAYLPAQRS